MSVRAHGRVTGFIGAMLAGLVIISACVPARVDGTPPATGDGAPVRGGRAIIGVFADAKVLNPVLSSDVPSAEVWGRIFESLITVDPQTAEPLPRLAERFSVSEDNKTLTFTLRPGLVWSDGSPFTGEDVRFTAEAVMRSKKSVRKNVFQDVIGARAYADGKAATIEGISIEGDTITFRLEKANCPALTNIGLFGIIPKSVFGKYLDPADPSKNLDEAPENTAPPLATGPFVFKEWHPNDRVVLVRNDRFAFGPALLDEWIYKVHPDATALAAALKTGEVDVARVDARDLDDLRQQEHLAFYPYLAPGYTYIGWNQLRGGKEFFQSRAVRQALAYGLDIQAVIDTVLGGQGQRMLAHTPPTSWAYDPDGLNDYRYDPQKARALLEADGWSLGPDGVYEKDGQRLEFTMLTNAGNKIRESLLQIAVEQYRQIGVAVTPRTESFEALTDRLSKSRDPKYGDEGGRDFDAVILGWNMGPDPDTTVWHSSQIKNGQNQIGFRDPEVDQALESGRTVCGIAERKQAYKTFNQRLNEEQPYNFGFAVNTLLFANKRIQGLAPGPFPNLQNSYLWNVERWWVQP